MTETFVSKILQRPSYYRPASSAFLKLNLNEDNGNNWFKNRQNKL